MIIYAYTTTDNKQSLSFSHTITSIFSICQEIEWNKQFWFLIFSVQITVELPSCSKIEEYTAVISLQMIMVSPGTHFVKNHESQSMNQWFPVKKNKNSTKRKTIGPLCNQTVSLKTDFKTLNYSVRKLKYSPILKHDKG